MTLKISSFCRYGKIPLRLLKSWVSLKLRSLFLIEDRKTSIAWIVLNFHFVPSLRSVRCGRKGNNTNFMKTWLWRNEPFAYSQDQLAPYRIDLVVTCRFIPRLTCRYKYFRYPHLPPCHHSSCREKLFKKYIYLYTRNQENGIFKDRSKLRKTVYSHIVSFFWSEIVKRIFLSKKRKKKIFFPQERSSDRRRKVPTRTGRALLFLFNFFFLILVRNSRTY